MTDADCPFCAIVVGDKPAYRLHEDDGTLAVLDAHPAAAGHALVVPKPHCEDLQSMDRSLVGGVFETTQRIARAVETALDADGITVLQSNGSAAGQEVFHAHVHVVPRHEGDALEIDWPAATLSPGDGERRANEIRAALEDGVAEGP